MIARKLFGRTGHESTRTLFGAAALGGVTQEEANRTLDLLLEYGVNHIDTAASYGESEVRIGPWLRTHRDEFFLATKTGKRTYREAWDELHTSLKRLQVDYVDLWQMHNLIQPEDWDVAMGPGGALEAFVEAREKGLVRFLGVTGHGVGAPKIHMKSLGRFDFNSVLLPYNYVMAQNPRYIADFDALVALCKERKVAVQTIKSICQRPWNDDPHTRATWYKPLEDQEAVDKAVHWVLGNDYVFLNTVGDIHVLPKVLEAATRAGARPSDEVMDAMVAGLGMEPLFV
ncbi:MAG: aldo/keto reductase [Anaerolineae bacterium]|nr:aldo/keto reductase [Anaerolineae bacterium]